MSEGAPPVSATASYDAPPATYNTPAAAPMAPVTGRDEYSFQQAISYRFMYCIQNYQVID